MTIITFENFPNKSEWLRRAGKHSSAVVPSDDEQRLYFALLEAIDWQCFTYKDCPSEPSESKCKTFLKTNLAKIKCSLPSYLGVVVGVYDFLKVEGIIK